MALELPLSLWIASVKGWYRPPRDARDPTWRQATLIGAFMWAGYFLVLWALSIAPLAVVAPVRETPVVRAAGWGAWRLRERQRSASERSGAVGTLPGGA